ncbi:MAG: 3-phosphoshikimate 1-carboxyvinyltransferase [Ignavibacteriales bacterium]
MATGSHRKSISIRPPGDKSISHRSAMFGALAEGETVITNYSPGQDCATTLDCLRALGVRITQEGDGVQSRIRIEGKGMRGLSEPKDILDCGNSGTTMRLLAGILAGQPFMTVLTGDDSLRRRPMGRIVQPLLQMGARIDGREGGLKAPLVIRGGSEQTGAALRPLEEYTLPVASAQVKSCIILAGLFADGTTTIIEPVPSRDHTERMMTLFGGELHSRDGRISVRGFQRLHAANLQVPGDASSAAFWLAAGAILPGSDIRVEGTGLNPSRCGFMRALQRMGCRMEFAERQHEWEPSGDVRVTGGSLTAIEVSPADVPALLDELPVLAVCAAVARGRTVVKGAAELRHKESDRISAIVGNLRAMGAAAGETPDGFWVEGGKRLRGCLIETQRDHRIAMAFAIAGLAADGETVLDDPGCIDISYPGFLETLGRLRETL